MREPAANKYGQKAVSASGLLPAAVFYLISALLLPITLLGYVIWIGKGILSKRSSGVSRTAQGPLSARWLEHNLGTRQDEPANRLMMMLLGVPHLGLRLSAGPILFAHHVAGYVPKAFRYPFEGDIPRSTRPPPARRSSTTPLINTSTTLNSSSFLEQASIRAPTDCLRIPRSDPSR